MQPLLVSYERIAQLMALELYQDAFDLLLEFHKNSLALQAEYRAWMMNLDEREYERRVFLDEENQDSITWYSGSTKKSQGS